MTLGIIFSAISAYIIFTQNLNITKIQLILLLLVLGALLSLLSAVFGSRKFTSEIIKGSHGDESIFVIIIAFPLYYILLNFFTKER